MICFKSYLIHLHSNFVDVPGAMVRNIVDQLCACWEAFAMSLLFYISKTWPGSQREFNSPPLSACQPAPGELCPFWELLSMRKKLLHTRAHLEQSPQYGLGSWNIGKRRKAGFFQLKRKSLAWRKCNCCP